MSEKMRLSPPKFNESWQKEVFPELLRNEEIKVEYNKLKDSYIKATQGRVSGTSGFSGFNIMIANTFFLMFMGYIGMKLFPNKKEEITTVTNALNSILNL